MNKEILNREDIELMVNNFYAEVREDDLLGDIFNERIQDNWDEHFKKMYRFWASILLDEQSYTGQPFPKHLNLPISKVHFERWVALFNTTIDKTFKGEKAEEAKLRANNIAQIFNYKIESIKSHTK